MLPAATTRVIDTFLSDLSISTPARACPSARSCAALSTLDRCLPQLRGATSHAGPNTSNARMCIVPAHQCSTLRWYAHLSRHFRATTAATTRSCSELAATSTAARAAITARRNRSEESPACMFTESAWDGFYQTSLSLMSARCKRHHRCPPCCSAHSVSDISLTMLPRC